MGAAPPAVAIPASPGIAAAPHRPLTAVERDQAETAWAYLAANTDPTTGLVASVAGFPATTLWDTGSYLAGLIAAERLGIVARNELDRRAARLLESLARLPLVEGRLPNKSIDTRTLAMLTYDGKPAPGGVGWSALDIARIVVPLVALERAHPAHAAAVGRVLHTWDLGAAVRDGQLLGSSRGADGVLVLHQEGRLGYEQYAARALLLLGLDSLAAAQAGRHLGWAEVEGVEVPADDRTAERWGAHGYTLSEPYLLTGLELGWDGAMRELGWRVYLAQAARYAATGRLTAVTEDHLDRAPHFIYASVWSAGRPWMTLAPDGSDASGSRLLSTKAAFAWDALYGTDYTRRLVEAVQVTRAPGKGWLAGRYEADGSVNAVLSLNTNAVILESLCYRAHGPLLHAREARLVQEAAR
jgi:hypothetical protein